MNIAELQDYMHDLIEDAYRVAVAEGQDEILFPFTIRLTEKDQVEFVPLNIMAKRALHSSKSSLSRN